MSPHDTRAAWDAAIITLLTVAAIGIGVSIAVDFTIRWLILGSLAIAVVGLCLVVADLGDD